MVDLLNKMPNEKIIEQEQRRLSKKLYNWLSLDLRILRDPESPNTILDLYREHYKQGVHEYMEDGRVLTTDWSFRLEDVSRSYANPVVV